MKSGLKQILLAVAVLAVFIGGLKIYNNLQPMSEEAAALSSVIAECNKITQRSNAAVSQAQEFMDKADAIFESIDQEAETLSYIADKYYELSQKEEFTEEDLRMLKFYYDYLVSRGVNLKATQETTATTPNYEQIIEDIDKAVSESQAFRSEAEKIFQALDEGFIALVNIADNYYALSQKAQLADDDKDMLAYYYNYITEYGLDLTGRIDETTKAYQDSQEKLEELMIAQFKKLYVQTAQALLPGAIEQNVKLQEILAEAEKALPETQE